ncbi:MAG: universal stress protein [Alphaproteobacteria bacterium]|jgi:nucleotide-binding universal stress UspA family protein|nr:universal stress protein [Alphaproteobacteria bacterium]
MAITTLLLHMAHDRARLVRFRIGLALAQRYGAHLAMTYMTSPAHLPAEVTGRAASAAYIAEQTAIAHEKADHVLTEISEEADAAGISWDWEVLEDDHNQLLAERSHYADMVIVCQGHGGVPEGHVGLHHPDDLLFMASCPVLVLPQHWTSDEIGHRVLVAWKDTREAARALRDSLPILEKADDIFVLTCDPPHHRFDAGVAAVAFLGRHGLRVEQVSDSANGDVGDVILSYAKDLRADLLIMGAYGHSRFREIILGGVTQHVLRNMARPALMAH